jgi:hypothetical protein
MKLKLGLLIALLGLALLPVASPADEPIARAAATCADHPNQAAAQRAGDTRDADGDGVYCESLPCPCSAAPPGSGGSADDLGDEPPASGQPSCTKPRAVQRLVFSARKYPHIRSHYQAAVRKGWPKILVLNRPGADARRDRLLEDIPTRAGQDRDEYPPAVGRGKGKGLGRGTDPRGWKADVRYVPSSENRSHGSSLGAKLRRFCNGTRFRYAFSTDSEGPH